MADDLATEVEPTTTPDADTTPAVEPTTEPEANTDAPPSIADDSTPSDDVGAPPVPEDADAWRRNFSGDDKDRSKWVNRYKSIDTALAAGFNAHLKLQQGVKAPERPADTSDVEAMKAYREQLGLSNDFEEYTKAIQLPDGVEVGEADKPVLDAFAQRYFDEGMGPESLSVAYDQYLKLQEQAAEAQITADSAYRDESERVLREQMPGEYSKIDGVVKSFFKDHPEAHEIFRTARDADGNVFGNNPTMLNMIYDMGLQMNPLASMPQGMSDLSSIDNRMAEIQDVMATDMDKYDGDPAMQNEYRELLEAQNRMQSRG